MRNSDTTEVSATASAKVTKTSKIIFNHMVINLGGVCGTVSDEKCLFFPRGSRVKISSRKMGSRVLV